MEIENKSGITIALGNIGNVYSNQGDISKALEYYLKALKVSQETGDRNNTSIWLADIGIVYFEQGSYLKALEYYFKALKIEKEL